MSRTGSGKQIDRRRSAAPQATASGVAGTAACNTTSCAASRAAGGVARFRLPQGSIRVARKDVVATLVPDGVPP